MAPKPKAPVCDYTGPMEGEGSFYYQNGGTYCGAWRMIMPPEDATPPADGSSLKPTRVRHGKGVFTDGQYSYDGDFADDAMHGQGKACYGSGATYVGEWRENRYHGRGKYTWADSKAYDGEFLDNVMHGKGTITDAAGRSWSGQFAQGSGPGLTYDLP